MFEEGNPGGPGGARPGAGRPADWLRKRCQKAVEEKDLIGFLEKVANGEDMEQVVTDKGEAIAVPAAIRDRHKAVEILLDRGYGKPEQPITGPDNSEFQAIPAPLLTAFINALTGGKIEGPTGGAGAEEGK